MDLGLRDVDDANGAATAGMVAPPAGGCNGSCGGDGVAVKLDGGGMLTLLGSEGRGKRSRDRAKNENIPDS